MASSIFGPRAVQPRVPMAMPTPTPTSTSSPESDPGIFEGLQQIKNLMGMIRGGGNAGKMAEYARSTHPDYQKVMDSIRQHGGNGQAAFYAEARKRGADPEQIIRLLR